MSQLDEDGENKNYSVKQLTIKSLEGHKIKTIVMDTKRAYEIIELYDIPNKINTNLTKVLDYIIYELLNNHNSDCILQIFKDFNMIKDNVFVLRRNSRLNNKRIDVIFTMLIEKLIKIFENIDMKHTERNVNFPDGICEKLIISSYFSEPD